MKMLWPNDAGNSNGQDTSTSTDVHCGQNRIVRGSNDSYDSDYQENRRYRDDYT